MKGFASGFAFKAALTALTMMALGTATAQAERAKTVVELFTSQGCSYCPPADDLLRKMAQRDDIVALAFHVDYWDYLGWQDTFGSSSNSERQRAYAKARGDHSVYTPQLVVNGQQEVIGNDARAVESAVSASETLDLDISANMTDTSLEVKLKGTDVPADMMADVYLLKVTKDATVQIARGENAGKERQYTNIVRDIMPIGMWSGDEQTFHLPKSAITGAGETGWVVMVQAMKQGLPSQILGAALAVTPQ